MPTISANPTPVESAVAELKKYSRYRDGQTLHTVIIEDCLSFTRMFETRFSVFAKPGHACGAFWRNGNDSHLFDSNSVEAAVYKIACTFGLENILIIVVEA